MSENYSAKHWSNKAASYASEAADSETNALEYKSAVENLLTEIKTLVGSYLRYINANTTEWIVTEEALPSRAFYKCTQIEKVWIPSTCMTIEASNYLKSPFYGCSSTCQIFTDVASEDDIPQGWGVYWNYYSETGTLTVNYNSSIDDFNDYSSDDTELEDIESGEEVEIVDPTA